MDLYKFMKTLKDNDYKINPNELKELTTFIKHKKDYRIQKNRAIINEICDFEDTNGYSSEFGDSGIEFFIGQWTIYFEINPDNNHVIITGESYSGEHIVGFTYDQDIGKLSFNTIAFALDLFKKYGKYVDMDNPTIGILLDERTNMDIKSARAVI